MRDGIKTKITANLHANEERVLFFKHSMLEANKVPVESIILIPEKLLLYP